jgi:hypothetical protein
MRELSLGLFVEGFCAVAQFALSVHAAGVSTVWGPAAMVGWVIVVHVRFAVTAIPE